MNARLLGAVVIAVIGLLRALSQPLNADAAWFHYVAGRVLSGARPYVDLIEVNPPLIIWLSMPSLLLERATGISHAIGYPVLVGVAACVSLAASHRLSEHAMSTHYKAPFTAAIAVVLFVLPWWQWGQREHLLLILCIPHLISAAARLRGRPPPSFIAHSIAAGLGYSLKPHFALCFLAVELLVWARTRRVWPIAFVIAGTETERCWK